MRVLIASFGSFGDLNPYIGLGRALGDRGHDPILAVPAYYVPFAEAAGLRALAIRPDVDPNARDLVRRIMDPMTGAAFLVRDLMMPVVHESYEDLDAAAADVDLIVSHPLTFAAPLVAERRALPWASSVLAPIGFFSRGDPPLMLVNPVAEAVQRRLPWLNRAMVGVARRTTRPWGRAVHDLRAKLGLPPGGDPVQEGQFSPHGVVAMFSPLLAAPQPDWPARTIVTGAVSYDAVLGGMPADLVRFLDAGPPPVVFTLGSAAVASASAPRFYEASIDAVAAVGARAVLLVGRHDGHRPEVRGRTDIHVAEWAPHSELFARASAVVHQGGAGTLHTALASGRPMLIVPFSHDQGDNAVRARRLGGARIVFPSRYSAKAVARQLEALLGDPGIAAHAADVGGRVRQERGAERACEALESIAGAVRPVVSKR